MRPKGLTGTLPVVIYIHGGGWALGNSHTHDRLIREPTVGTKAAVVFPSYSLSPEARYPTAIEECYAVLQWVGDHGADKGLDASRIVYVRSSASWASK
jgi:acetyl esterase